MTEATLRPIQKMQLPGIEPAKLGKVEPVFERAKPETLHVDETYQRNLSERSVTLIRRIVANWDWARFKPPVVVRAPGKKFHVIDGQHTAIAAASHPEIDSIPVMVVDAPNVEDRARAFIGHNRDRITVTPNQLYIAAVAAGDPDAVTVQQVCERAGVRILRLPPGGGGLQARRDAGGQLNNGAGQSQGSAASASDSRSLRQRQTRTGHDDLDPRGRAPDDRTGIHKRRPRESDDRDARCIRRHRERGEGLCSRAQGAGLEGLCRRSLSENPAWTSQRGLRP